MIYVDDPVFPFHGEMFCHMATDGDLTELHEMARKIGLHPAWFQNKPGAPHYDLSLAKRAQAVAHGAQAVTTLELIRKCFKKRGNPPV